MQYPERIMVVGNGGRECALANACLLSPNVEQLIITPPNWGLVDPVGGRVAVLEIKAADFTGIVAAAKEHRADLVIVGPEDPLCGGLADEIRSAGIAALGPGRDAAQLEGSKSYANQFMARHGIPTAESRDFTDADKLMDYLEQAPGQLVLKADGLASGKGVIVCSTKEETMAAAERIAVQREFGASGDLVVVEERLFGPEISWTCLISGDRAELLGVSTDYKPLLDGNEGPNTGGMGNMCPTPYATAGVEEEFRAKILAPFMAGLAADGLDYRGFLFIGTMLTEAGLKVLEFNVRIGDPEAQVVLPMNNADWPAVLAGAAGDEWFELPKMKRDAACVAVALASGNYPYGKSEPARISGFDRVHARGLLKAGTAADGSFEPAPVSLYFAGVGREALAGAGSEEARGYQSYYENLGQFAYMASGGRVLAVSAMGENLSEARRLAYEVVGNLQFDGMKFRSDIGRLA